MSAAPKVKIVKDAGKRGLELRGDHRVLISAKEHIVILSGPADCLAGETIIDGASRSIKELCDEGIAPIVKTLYGEHQASIPFVKGYDWIYEIKTQCGETIRTARNHLMLTSQGFVSVSSLLPGVCLIGYEAFHPSSISDSAQLTRVSNALHLSKRVQGYQESYPVCFLKHGEQLHLQKDNGQVFAPLPIGAREPDHCYCKMDAQGGGAEYSHLYQSIDRLSNDYFSILKNSYLAPSQVGSCEGICEQSGFLHQFGDQSQKETFPFEQALSRGTSDDHTYQGEFLYAGHRERRSSSMRIAHAECSSQASRQSSRHEGFPDTLHGFEKKPTDQISSWPNFNIKTRIVSTIRRTRKECYYDLSVPGADHYFANGMIHHNCGKSVACCAKTHLICLRCPGAQGAIIRKTKASLKETILNTFDRIVKNQGVTKLGGNNPHSYVYPNGSKIWLGGMDKPDKVLSAERDFIQICQAEELSQNDIEIMATRCSGRASVIAVPQIFGDCNPGPRNHWIKQMEKAGTLRLLNATHKDNPTLYNSDGTMIDSDDVRRRMKVLDDLTGVRRLRLRDGIWATAEGAVYEMFNAQQTGSISDHVQVRQRSEMQRFYFALDDGFTNPAVILDIGSDSDGRWHIFREFYKRGWVQDDVAKYAKGWNQEIQKLNGRGVDLAAVDEAAPGLVEALKQLGINAMGGKGKIFDGIAKIQAKLKVQGDGRPRLTIDPCCTETINEFESYVWKQGKDVPVDDNNHSLGSLRYLSDVLNEPTGAFDSVAGIRAGSPKENLFEIGDLSADDLGLNVDLT